MRSQALTALSLIVLWPTLATTAPPTALCGHESSPPAWRRLSDAIVRKIWGVPESQVPLNTNNPVSALVGGTPPTKLMARYGEDLVLRFNLSTAAEASKLAEAVDLLFLDVWESNADWVDIRIAKNVVPSLLGLLPQSLQNAHVPLMQNLDLAQAILDSYPSPSSTSHNDRSFSPSLKTPAHSENIFFQDYQPLSVITPWMNLMASMFSTHVRRIDIGISYEGRDIPALRVGVHPTNDDQPSKPRQTVLITGGSHAREWVSVSTVNYVAWNLITSYGKDHTITKLLENFDFIFVPTLNPDGYVYSWETDRLWRKNRQPTSLRFCRGIDLDRSYSYQWDGPTVQANPCSESYAGDAPFDAIESRRFAEWAKNETEQNNVNFVALLDLHSYSQQILYPYSYSCDKAPPTEEDLEELAMGLSKAIRTSHKGKGQHYQVSSACEGNVAMSKKDRVVLPRIEPSGGSALDWFYHELKVQYPYQIKLRDTGSYGFLLPRENIVPTGKEMLDAVLYLGRFLSGEVGFAVDGEESDSEHQDPVVADTKSVYDEEREKYDLSSDSSFELRRKRR